MGLVHPHGAMRTVHHPFTPGVTKSSRFPEGSTSVSQSDSFLEVLTDSVFGARSAQELGRGNLFVPRLLESDETLWQPLTEPTLAAFHPDQGGLVELGRSYRGALETILHSHGALLFRGFESLEAVLLREFIEATSSGSMSYEERSSPRTEVTARIYTSTDYPQDQVIFPHNEHSYARTHPCRLYFQCVHPAEHGGATPTVDCRKVLARLSLGVRKRFERLGWMYVRNFGGGLGLDWPVVFRTNDEAAVERYCATNAIEWEWRTGNRLRTRQRRMAITKHPVTREDVWFNHVAFFHISTLPRELGEVLLATLREEELPNNTYYGDGSPIHIDVLHEIRAAYLAEATAFQWRSGDVLVLDNLLTAHGRLPFRGERKVLLGMADPLVLS